MLDAPNINGFPAVPQHNISAKTIQQLLALAGRRTDSARGIADHRADAEAAKAVVKTPPTQGYAPHVGGVSFSRGLGGKESAPRQDRGEAAHLAVAVEDVLPRKPVDLTKLLTALNVTPLPRGVASPVGFDVPALSKCLGYPTIRPPKAATGAPPPKAAAKLHPCSNRGVVKPPEPDIGVELGSKRAVKPVTRVMADRCVGMDWLRVTHRLTPTVGREMVRRVADDLVTCGEELKPLYNYTESFDLASYGRLLTRWENGMLEICVDLPGSALETLRQQGWTDQTICQYFAGWRCTRLDGAVDVTDNRITPAFIDRMFPDNLRDQNPLGSQVIDDVHAVTTVNRVGWYSDRKVRGPHRGESSGTTLYIGSRSSSRFMRVYDKVAEKLAKTGEQLVDDQGNVVEHLTRLELEIKGKKGEAATHAMGEIAAKGSQAILDLISGWIDFRVKDSNARAARMTRCDWWERIIGDATPVKPGLTLNRSGCPPKSKKWVAYQCVETLSLYLTHDPDGFMDVLRDANPSVLKHKKWAEYERRRRGDGEEEESEPISCDSVEACGRVEV